MVSSIESEYRRYKSLGEKALAQLSQEELSKPGPGGGNSVAILVWHVAGNLKSRFLDFVTSDGEKPWRKRDSEFEPRKVTPSQLLQRWEDGWEVLFQTLEEVTDRQLEDRVIIRGQELTVQEALHRSLAHTSYHVGQIVYIAKSFRGNSWEFLSIPPGKSEEYNRNPV